MDFKTITLVMTLAWWAAMSQCEAQIFPRRQKTKPCLVNGIPMSGYTASTRSISKRLLSLSGISDNPAETIPSDAVSAASVSTVEANPLDAIATSLAGATPLDPGLVAPLPVTSAPLSAAVGNGKATIEEIVAEALAQTSLPPEIPVSSNNERRNLDSGGLDSILNQPLASELLADSRTLTMRPFRTLQTLRPGSRRGIPNKVFTFPRSLTIDHCRISAMAVYLQSDGRWTVSLRAEQNPTDLANRQTVFLKQNEFVVSIRCLGQRRFAASALLPEVDREAYGASVISQLGPISFYVRNGEPRTIVAKSDQSSERRSRDADFASRVRVEAGTTTAATIRSRFAQIDQVELEFYYRGKSANLPLHRVSVP